MTQCIVTIDITEHYLLPRKQALQLVDLMAQAKKVDRRYTRRHGDDNYVVKNPPSVMLETVTTKKLIYTEETTQEGVTP